MLNYDRVILYNSKTNGFCEGPLLELEMEGGYQSVSHINIGTYIENEWGKEEEVFHRAVEAQKKYDNALEALRKVEYELRCKEKELDKLKMEETGNAKQAFNWRYE